MLDRIWLEFEKPGESEHVRCRADMERVCAKVNRMLHRLGPEPESKEVKERVFVFDNKGFLMYALNDGGGFLVLNDGGHWFNLDYMGRE